MSQEGFGGFSESTFSFIAGLEKDNTKKYFDANRKVYEEHLVKPAKDLVNEIGKFFSLFAPSIRTEPKFNQTLMRMNNDMRFSKGNPYRTYFLIHFGRFKLDSEFYLFIDKDGIDIGLFLNKSKGDEFFFQQNMEKYKDELLSVFKTNSINKNYSLLKLDKMPEMLHSKFDSVKHFDDLQKLKFALIEKQFPVNSRECTTYSLLFTVIKIFTKLYPIYCFSVSPNPMKSIDEFHRVMKR